MMKRTLVLFACVASVSAGGRADVRLNTLFADHMVIQRDRPIRVWGLAEPGEKVTATLDGATASTTADTEGRWRLELPARDKGEDLELTVIGKNSVTVKDVLIGDVWVCGGQSNMNMPMNFYPTDKETAADIEAADFPKIRRVKIDPNGTSIFEEYNTPIRDPWHVCTPQKAGAFTAAGFYFARAIHRKTDVPVGLIDVNRGGTRIETWMPYETVKAYSDRVFGAVNYSLNRYINGTLPAELAKTRQWAAAMRAAIRDGRLHDADGKPDAPAPHISVKSLDQLEQWLDWAEAAYKSRQFINEQGRRLPPPPKVQFVNSKDAPLPAPIYIQSPPNAASGWLGNLGWSFLYRGAIHPLTRFPIKGVIWYQGESNALTKDFDPSYGRKQRLLIEGWRTAWGQGDFPFYYVQLPCWPWRGGKVGPGPAGGDGWAIVRDAQLKGLAVPNTGMAVTIDIGDESLHPPNKVDVGERLARWALANDYGVKDIVVSGPIYRERKIEDDRIRLFFDYAESGLMVATNRKPLDGPPAVGCSVFRKKHPAQWTDYHNLLVYLPVKKGERLVLGTPVTVTESNFGVSNHSGGYSFAVTMGNKTHIVFAEIPDDNKGNPTYAATIDRTTRTVVAKTFLLNAPPGGPDIHSTPVIAADLDGGLDVVTGAHGQSFFSLRSLAPNRVDAGWSKPETVGRGQAYATLCCDAEGRLHCVYRVHPRLRYQRRDPGADAWTPTTDLVRGPVGWRGYTVFYHRLFIDRNDALYVSFTYSGNDQLKGTCPRALAVSEDGGETWRLASTAVFQRRVVEIKGE